MVASGWAREIAEKFVATPGPWENAWSVYNRAVADIAAALREAEGRATAVLHDLLSGAWAALNPEENPDLCKRIEAVLNCGLGNDTNGPCHQYEVALTEAVERGRQEERWACYKEAVTPGRTVTDMVADRIAARGPMSKPEEE